MFGLTTQQLIDAGRASGRLIVPSLEPRQGGASKAEGHSIDLS
jgi:hypothetical protein